MSLVIFIARIIHRLTLAQYHYIVGETEASGAAAPGGLNSAGVWGRLPVVQ